jgi:hypothetical protein
MGRAVIRRRVLAALVLAGTLAACAGVLGLHRRSSGPAPFPHRAHVVAGVTCTTCHTGIPTAGDTGALHLPTDATCVGCHVKPHDTRPCLGCHSDPIAAGQAAEAKAHIRFDHQRHLSGPAKGNCARCHTSVAERDAPMRPAMMACWGCHEHDRARDLRTCSGCHVDLAEEGTPPESHLAHDSEFAGNHGTAAASSADLCGSCHRETFCASCHGVTVPMIPARLRFADPFAPSVHRAGFAARHSEEARAAPGSCSSCHTPERCLDCHTDRGVAGLTSASPHPRGWVGIGAGDNDHGRAARIDPASCASCHGGAGEQLCVGCHKVGGVGGNPHPPGWSSRQPMSALPCRLCHTIGAGP